MKCEFFKPSDFEVRSICHYNATQLGQLYTYEAAEKANRLLAERGTVVYASWRKEGMHEWSVWDVRKGYDAIPNTHQAMLIDVKPIETDTAESLLRDYLEEYETFQRGHIQNISVAPWVDRVRKLLEKK